MKKLLFVLSLSLVLASCGKVNNIPEKDSAKWKSYLTYFKGVRFKYKFPGMDGKANYRWHNSSVSERDFREGNYTHFFFARYDTFREINHFDIMITIYKYETELPADDSFDAFNKCQEKIFKKIFKNYQSHDIKDGINGRHIYLFRENDSIRGSYTEIFSYPLDKEYYIDISAHYYLFAKQFEQNWLASRRKIFKEFAENVEIIRPEKYPIENDTREKRRD